ncbi:helix-turn-helix transcriptional regulator [Cronobacter malonaticus]|uniref:helix-turn-helix transcriptional regulator n=1 Tax=Cronobacter TaxID=413496 RepID=UPI0008FC0819|nr:MULTISPECIES: helix-turn-helix transcriptional regulator [Cronobacter]EKY3245049.1 helix-turn-helix transcriptional regulator [Cronobacter dublinensis]MDI7270421.1 helix-turn-helix transcriptional regulator [Cronobacter dublinensis]MDK1256903.1 helix-turn-helix transcriptional regulator [Cronobacter malonaticus]MDK1321586.1 helix-turn-helix transcriptional regulator [Cronobacter malonaticus]
MQSPLRKLRNSHGYTLSHVAGGVQVDPATLSRIERCEQVPSVELAEKLVKFYDGEIDELQILYPSRYQTTEQETAKPGNANLAAN